MRKLLLGTTTLTALLLAGAAQAADLPRKAPGPPPYAPPPFSWTGFYIGGVVGGGVVTPYFVDFDENFSFGNWHAGDWAFTGGGTVGYNWQWGAAVFGIEADFNWTSFDVSLINNSFATQFDAKWDWYTTVRARFGLAVDRVLVFVTAGVAFVDLDYRVFNVPPSAVAGCGPAATNDCAILNKTEAALAVGAGVEYAWMHNWSFKAEYLYIKLPTKDIFDSFDPSPDRQYQFTTDAHFARVGLNYRWGAPLVARY
jgi:outer membrane immunogenic protein